MNHVAKHCALLAALLAVGLAAILSGCNHGPSPLKQRIQVPRMSLGGTYRVHVLRGYGPPRQKTATELWYVGPTAKGLVHGADGWMTLLDFDDAGRLRCQEYLTRGVDLGYVTLEYSIHGRLGMHDREKDFDKLIIARAIELAGETADYQITLNESDAFTMARLLPSQNEPVVQWKQDGQGDDTRVTLTVRALPGRDDALIAHIDAAVGMRMLLIEIPNDANEASARDR